MYMRYYPKIDRVERRLNASPLDRGKKHYWSIDRGDYGFIESADKNNKSNSHRKHQINHQCSYVKEKSRQNESITKMIDRSMKIENSFRENHLNENPEIRNYQGRAKLDYSLESKSKGGLHSERPRSRVGTIIKKENKDINELTNESSIYLPRVTSKYNQPMVYPQKQTQSPTRGKPIKRQIQTQIRGHRRNKTQNIYEIQHDYDKWQDPRFRSYGSHLQYSPTFTSSIQNPLPAPYIRSPSRYRTFEYQLVRT